MRTNTPISLATSGRALRWLYGWKWWKASRTISMTLWSSPVLSTAERRTVTVHCTSDKGPHPSLLASSECREGGINLSPDKQRQRISNDISKQWIYFPITFLKPKGSTKHSKDIVQSMGISEKCKNISYLEKPTLTVFYRYTRASYMRSSWLLERKKVASLGNGSFHQMCEQEKSWFLLPPLWILFPPGKRLSCFSFHWTLNSSCSQISYRGMREKGERQIVGFPVIWLAMCLLKWMGMLLLFPTSWISCLKRTKDKTATEYLFLFLRDS